MWSFFSLSELKMFS